MELPQIPTSISSDGKELWDWAAQCGSAIHRQAKINDLRRQIRDVSNKCGSCVYWMTRDCPREKNVNGRNVGPSCNGWACSKFVEKSYVTELKGKWQAELDQITTTH